MNIKTLIILGLGGGTLLVIIILIAISFASLEFTEIGLDYSSISKSVDKVVYSGGISFLGVGHSFIKFPKTIQTVEFSLEADADLGLVESRTSDGLEVKLEISLQYQLIPNKLYELYMSYELKYKQMILSIAVDSLTDMATKFTAYDFFMNRGKIGADMQIALNNVLQNRTYCTVEFFQLRDVDLPDKFEEAIQLTEVKKQDIHKAEAEKSKMKVEIQTRLITAQLNMQVIVNLAHGEAEAILSANQGTINGFNATETNSIEGLASLKDQLEMTNEDLINYMETQLIRDYQGSDLVVGIS